MTPLFSDDDLAGGASTGRVTTNLHPYEEIARERLSMPPSWRMYKWEAKGKFVVVTGGVVTRLIEKGKRKGSPDWKSITRETDLSFPVTEDDIEDFWKQYEQSTGNCRICQGSGKEWTGWNHLTGNGYKPCTGCGATGARP